MTHSESVKEIGLALSRAQGAIEGASKTSDNPFFKSKYADLASVWDACRKQLTDNGLSVVQAPFVSPDGVGVNTLLLHASGEWIESSITAVGKDSGPQSVGSVISYLRRYSLAAMVGIYQVDDDAESAEGRNGAHATSAKATKPAAAKPAPTADNLKPSNGGAFISEAQGKRLWAIAKGAGWTQDQIKKLLSRCHIEHTKDIKSADYTDIVSAVEAGPVAAGVE